MHRANKGLSENLETRELMAEDILTPGGSIDYGAPWKVQGQNSSDRYTEPWQQLLATFVLPSANFCNNTQPTIEEEDWQRRSGVHCWDEEYRRGPQPNRERAKNKAGNAQDHCCTFRYGVWSLESGRATSFPSCSCTTIARLSPTFATHISLPSRYRATAVVPDRESSTFRFWCNCSKKEHKI